VLAYYTQNQSQYGTPESRDVRHILIAEKGADGQVDFEKSKAKADQIYAELEGGAGFASLAKANSEDPGSKDSGGKLTISRGQTVPEFDRTSFELDQGELSKPVKTQYGYHVIEAVSPVRPAKTTPLDQVKASIRATLLQQKRNEVMSAWVEDLRSEYDGKVSYAVGYEPPELPEAPTETQ
jgi:parvulin-like peptidyl-prolyl isomerase